MMQEIDAMLKEPLFWEPLISVMLIIIGFAIYVMITRWVFKINRMESLLKEISQKMDGLKKEQPEVQTPQRTPQEMQEIYGDR